MKLTKLTNEILAENDNSPYIREIGKKDGLTLWLVHGDVIRKGNIEFTNFAHHWSNKKVPENEIWFDKEQHPGELKFFIPRAIFERQLMKNGTPYDAAVDKADEYEQKLRQGDDEGYPCHRRLLKKLGNGIDIWLVDGRAVRDEHDENFTEGGHGLVYTYIPKDEVWIDDDLRDDDRPFVIFHELHERNIMAKGEKYDRAHKLASKEEKFLRNNPEKLERALKQEGW